jgi:two-component system, LytTR family, response regulator
MLHALIIDDEEHGLKSLELLIKNFIPEIKIVATAMDPEQSVELINNYRPDLVFLDINMPKMNGFEVLNKIEFKKFQLIFTTAHEEYALQAIKKQAIDYLLKPVNIKELKKAVEKAQAAIQQETQTPDVLKLLREISISSMRVRVPTKAGVDLVPSEKVMYIEGHSNKAVITFSNGHQVKVICSLKEYEENLCLPETKFIRVHNSFIINLDHVTKYTKDDGSYTILMAKKNIPISKQKKEEFLRRINLDLENI